MPEYSIYVEDDLRHRYVDGQFHTLCGKQIEDQRNDDSVEFNFPCQICLTLWIQESTEVEQ